MIFAMISFVWKVEMLWASASEGGRRNLFLAMIALMRVFFTLLSCSRAETARIALIVRASSVGLMMTVSQVSIEHFSMEAGSVMSTVRQTMRTFFGTSTFSRIPCSISSRSISSPTTMQAELFPQERISWRRRVYSPG